MRLLNTTTYQLTEFSPQKIPVYAILSHTWNDEEVTFSDIQSHEKASKLKGYRKLVDFCKEAARHGLQWGWMDTCCIDKTSSAELSEAINSMFQWYKEAFVCYVYLEDFYTSENYFPPSRFGRSRWFTRAWCLQELLAPNNIVFYSNEWHDFGTKASLGKNIARITGIDVELLMGETYIGDYSIAQKMSWASSRESTRIEDMAYSLMGIFEVSMPLLYGEGWKAFKRLQEEIIRTSTDQSIFAWCARDSKNLSALAWWPFDFRNSSRIVPVRRRIRQYRPAHYVSNSGLQIDLPLYKPSEGAFAGVLDCYSIDEPETRVAIPLKWKDDQGWGNPFRSDSSTGMKTNQRLFCQRTDPHVLRNIRLEELDVRNTVALTVLPLWELPEQTSTSVQWRRTTDVSLVEQSMGISGCSLVRTFSKDYRHLEGWENYTRTVGYSFANEAKLGFDVVVEWLETPYSLPTSIKIKISNSVQVDRPNNDVNHSPRHEEEFSTDATFQTQDHQWAVRAKVRHGIKTTEFHTEQSLLLSVVVEKPAHLASVTESERLSPNDNST